MRGVFVDANELLAVIFERLEKPGDPKVRINRNPDIVANDYPKVLDGAEIAVVDHTALPTDVAKQCTGLKHVVFLGTGARSYMNPEEAERTRHRRAPDQGLWRHRGRRMRDRADVGSRARHCADGPRDARRQAGMREDAMQLTGKTLGLIGFGGIAAEVARYRRSASGMRVIAWQPVTEEAWRGVEFVDLDHAARTEPTSSRCIWALERRHPQLHHPASASQRNDARHHSWSTPRAAPSSTSRR